MTSVYIRAGDSMQNGELLLTHDNVCVMLAQNTAVIGGSFASGQSGWVAMTSHETGNTKHLFRLQLQQDGTVNVMESLDGGNSWATQRAL
jgi:inosine-uridine nucleoside N-ribohydrolase